MYATLTSYFPALIPALLSLIYLGLLGYSLFWQRRLDPLVGRFFSLYLGLSFLWHLALTLRRLPQPDPVPGLTWLDLAALGLIGLGALLWGLTQVFLQQPWRDRRVWGLAGLGLILSLILSLDWLRIPAPYLAWSRGWLKPDNLYFVLSGLWWAGLLVAAIRTTWGRWQQEEIQAHRNRSTYWLLALIGTGLGYGLFLSLIPLIWQIGLLLNLGSVLVIGYAVTRADLFDLGTTIRFGLNKSAAALISIAIYITGIAMVQRATSLFLPRSLPLNRTMLMIIGSAILLALLYTPIRSITRRATNKVIFGRHYDYQKAIQDYTQATNYVTTLRDLVETTRSHLGPLMQTEKIILFRLEGENEQVARFHALRGRQGPQEPTWPPLTLSKNTPLSEALTAQAQALAQYRIDLSPDFKAAPATERRAMKALGCEWYLPLLRQGKCRGILALGPKTSGRPYNPFDLTFLQTAANQTVIAMENATLIDRLRDNLSESRRMKGLMDNIFASVENGIITTDREGKITLLNRAAEAIFCLQTGQSIGQPYATVLAPLNQTILPNLLRNVIYHDQRYSRYIIETSLPERGPVSLSLNLAPLKDEEGETQGTAIVVDDRTETKRLEAVQDMFRRYVSPAVVDRLPADPSDLQLGGNRQVVTILFADIRGFTSFSEKLDPEAIVDALNEYLSMAAAAILMFEGTLDKFMGDAVMGIFNAPLPQEDHIMRAVRAAGAMQRDINEYHRKKGNPYELSFGVGLHTGEAVVGNVGMADRMDYTAIGDTVNLAKRIQENTPGGRVLMSDVVHAGVRDVMDVVFYKEMTVKNREEPVKTYELRYQA